MRNCWRQSPRQEVRFCQDSWVWNFGDDDIEYSQNPSHTYADTGSYTITLIVSNEGCTDTTQAEVKVLPSFLFFIPNAFTPNGDGTNDNFQAQGIGISEFNMIIFDRWGNAIFQSNNVNTSWDGGNSPSGIYIYRIDVIDYMGRTYEYTGQISLIR